jgi:UDP-N-acetyl-2-amino-2-deoxyglucuronate dehydrogenase
MNFAVVGVGGFVAPRHLKAIRDTGHRLIAAVDPNDSVGILDQFSFDVRYFREIERFDRHLDKLRRGPEAGRVHWVSVCSPNYLHDAHIRLALRNGANVICEKPLVINPWNLDTLQELETETGCRIATVLQLRSHPALLAIKARMEGEADARPREVVLTYITSRGPWYHVSWKGIEERSGGAATNIGIHLFDLLMWLFGPVGATQVHLRERDRLAGYIELQKANVRWFLSVSPGDLPEPARAAGRTTFRSMKVDDQEVEFTDGFTDLHTRVYARTLEGQGHGIAEARPSIELVHRIRTEQPGGDGPRHPFLARRGGPG